MTGLAADWYADLRKLQQQNHRLTNDANLFHRNSLDLIAYGEKIIQTEEQTIGKMQLLSQVLSNSIVDAQHRAKVMRQWITQMRDATNRNPNQISH